MSDQAGGMVERVARAIYASAGRSPPEPPWEDADQEVRDWISDHARAAIEAMLDPPDDVLRDLQAAATVMPSPVFMADAQGAWVWACGIASALGTPVERFTGKQYEAAPLPANARALINAALKPEGGETP